MPIATRNRLPRRTGRYLSRENIAHALARQAFPSPFPKTAARCIDSLWHEALSKAKVMDEKKKER
jgi:hypothetical protein